MTAVTTQVCRLRKGFALIAVMWVVIIAGLMLLGAQKAIRVNLATAYNELAAVRAHWLARAGVEQAMAVLTDDGGAADGATDQWYADEQSFRRVRLAGGEFSVTAPPGEADEPTTPRFGLIDLCGRLNVNTADENQLTALCELAPWQVSSILDWRDGDDEARSGGADGLYYERLRFGYLIRNGSLKTVDELRLVHGIDQQAFYGEDTNGNGTLDVNENDGSKSFPDDNADGRLTTSLAGLTTVYSYERNRDAGGGERVNVNTADKTKLVERFNFTDALADAVTKYRSSSKSQTSAQPGQGQGKASNRFNSLMDLLQVKASNTTSQQGDEAGKVKEITVKWLADHLDALTLTDDDRLEGRINVNTAPMAVLMTLPKMGSATAGAIVRRRQTGAGPFESVGELFTGNSISEEQFKAFAESLTVRSGAFEIRSSAVTALGIRHEIVAVVDRGAQPMNILYWYQSQ
ncbi:MAG: general secretion pathway protein GspK [Planctomycetes bacterium]|nr:general secretion pathway protein GspK [Planctomycetota bacterium]